MDRIQEKLAAFGERKRQVVDPGLYFYLRTVDQLDGAHVWTGGKRMLMLASYSYLGLIGHPKINAAARQALEKYGTGTHGVRILAGTLPVHVELEEEIARFKGTEAAIAYASGYGTNLSTISTLLGRNDIVICDKINHASIVDGCLLSGAKLLRFQHNDMNSLREQLEKVKDEDGGKLVVVDAVFSMDGDVTPLPEVVDLCREYNTWLMVDEAHSLGVLGKTGHGIEEHFGLHDAIPVNMGTLSKTIPAVGGYIAGSRELIDFLKHNARAFVFSAALPPPAAAAARAAFQVIEEEPWRVGKVQENARLFKEGLESLGFSTFNSQTPVVPILIGDEDTTLRVTRFCQDQGLFVLPVLSPAVPPLTARLRTTVTSLHSSKDIAFALDVLSRAKKIFNL
ncbi:MAG: aminotransferase class I/II-fold pyridoxal phosphate-dependent enzyme [Coprothermobacterota bacterium]|nr:aminotransferase class I/II-fold pyridoxal phosphate-dependent enzyme [Coprothermobacterota bacterium]